MRNFITIWRREMAACFLSPIAYVVMIVFLSSAAGIFFTQVFSDNLVNGDPLSSPLFICILMLMTILTTVVAMRLFAAEKRSGTMETLMTAPVTELEVVLGKYVGALTFLLIVAFSALYSLFLLISLSPGLTFAEIDVGAFFGGCFILVLMTAFWTASGLLISLLTKNQIVAGICIFLAIWMSIMLGWLVSWISVVSPSMVEYLLVEPHIYDFARGSIDTRPIVLYLSSTVFLLFVSIRILEAKRC